MTPSERAEARDLLVCAKVGFVTLPTEGKAPGERKEFILLAAALDQIDADERLMRDAVAVLVDLGACDDPECREPNCIHFLPRLRTRIGQKQEADDERK